MGGMGEMGGGVKAGEIGGVEGKDVFTVTVQLPLYGSAAIACICTCFILAGYKHERRVRMSCYHRLFFSRVCLE